MHLPIMHFKFHSFQWKNEASSLSPIELNEILKYLSQLDHVTFSGTVSLSMTKMDQYGKQICIFLNGKYL